MTFSVSNAAVSGNNSQINTLQVNDVTFNLDKLSMGIQTALHSHINFYLNYGLQYVDGIC